MLKKILLVSLSVFCSMIGIAQNVNGSAENYNSPFLIRSTLGSCGMSKVLETSKGTFVVSQSIGQASVIGTYTKNKYTIRQGFQQPLLLAQIIETPKENYLNANIFPNPFLHSINVQFGESVNEKLNVSIYNQFGEVLYFRIFPATQFINLPLTNFAEGNYILKITTENKQLISKIIKQ
jgi:hypothetical protein